MKLFFRFFAGIPVLLCLILSTQFLFAQEPCPGPSGPGCGEEIQEMPINSFVVLLIIAAKGLGIYKYLQLKKRKR